MALRRPTVSQLSDGTGVAVEIIADKTGTRSLIPRLIRLGATDIVEYQVNGVVDGLAPNLSPEDIVRYSQ
jgi:ATP phosphoribosyltransferase